MSDRLLTDIQHEEISLEELGHPIVYCKIKDLACVIEDLANEPSSPNL